MTDLQLTAEEIQALRDLLIAIATPHPRTGTDLEGNPMLPVPGEVIDAPWGQATVSRLAPRYSTAAIRDAAITSPDPGQLSYVEETDTIEIWYEAETRWRPIGSGMFLNLNGGTMLGHIDMGYHDVSDIRLLIFHEAASGWIRSMHQPASDGSGSVAGVFLHGSGNTVTEVVIGSSYNDVNRASWEPSGTWRVRGLFQATGIPGLETSQPANVHVDASGTLYKSTTATATEPYVNSLMVKLADRVKALETKIAQLEEQIDGS